MGLKLFNTMGRELQEFMPLIQGKAGFYSCGPTVYNYAHIGNLRAYVARDILARTLERFGFELCHVMNVTDVGHLSDDADEGEDRMVKTAEERGKTVLEIAEFYTKAFLHDMDLLNIQRPAIICKATDHVQEMIELIKRIEANGFTYFTGGNLYFDISKFPRYGDLALLRLDDLKAGARVKTDDSKKNPADFVLWFTKSKFEKQAMMWDSPWGRGYPGWHIECSAMSLKYLGEKIDIHAGGVDHIPVHHTNEIAQTEAATGRHPWVNYWFHNEFLIMGSNKMSKSSGDFITLKNVLDMGFDPMDYRYFLLGGHYRSQIQFSQAAMETAKNSRKSLMERISALAEKAPGFDAGAFAAAADNKLPNIPAGVQKYLAAFDKALEEDLSTPRAIAELWGLLRDNAPASDESGTAAVLAAALNMDRVLGLKLEQAMKKETGAIDPALAAEIDAFILERRQAKKDRNFGRADEIRRQLAERGIILTDSPSGTTWKRN